MPAIQACKMCITFVAIALHQTVLTCLIESSGAERIKIAPLYKIKCTICANCGLSKSVFILRFTQHEVCVHVCERVKLEFKRVLKTITLWRRGAAPGLSDELLKWLFGVNEVLKMSIATEHT